MNIFAEFHARIAAILDRYGKEGRLPPGLDLKRFVVEPPRDPSMGDLACNAAMVYAREVKSFYANPRQLATELAFDLTQERDVDRAEVAGPGFLNIRLKPRVFADLLRVIDDVGQLAAGCCRSIEDVLLCEGHAGQSEERIYFEAVAVVVGDAREFRV